MKMILEFNLPEDQSDANRALNVNSLYSAIVDYNQKLRNIIKHSDNEVEVEKAEWARRHLFESVGGDITGIFEF